MHKIVRFSKCFEMDNNNQGRKEKVEILYG
jgi:hypothetical protein